MKGQSMSVSELGVSLHTVLKDSSAETLLEALSCSKIVTTEIAAMLFAGGDDKALKADLLRGLPQTMVKPVSIHSLHGGGKDFSVSVPEEAERAVSIACDAVDLANEFDAELVVMHASSEPIADDERESRLDRALANFCRIGEYAGKHGRRIAIELLPRTCLGRTVDELLMLLDGLDPDVYGVCLDVNHLMGRYEELPEIVRRLGEKLITLHLSDYDGVDEKHWMPGRGVIDWSSFMQALSAIDYQGPFNYECHLDGESCRERVEALESNFVEMFGH